MDSSASAFKQRTTGVGVRMEWEYRIDKIAEEVEETGEGQPFGVFNNADLSAIGSEG